MLNVQVDPEVRPDLHQAMLKKGREEANAAVERERDHDRRRAEALHQNNKTLWVDHHYAQAELYARLSADHVRRAQSLQGMEA